MVGVDQDARGGERSQMRPDTRGQLIVGSIVFIILVLMGFHVNDAATPDVDRINKDTAANNDTPPSQSSSDASSSVLFTAAAYSGIPSTPSTGLFPANRNRMVSPMTPT